VNTTLSFQSWTAWPLTLQVIERRDHWPWGLARQRDTASIEHSQNDRWRVIVRTFTVSTNAPTGHFIASNFFAGKLKLLMLSYGWFEVVMETIGASVWELHLFEWRHVKLIDWCYSYNRALFFHAMSGPCSTRLAGDLAWSQMMSQPWMKLGSAVT
jgi:hypothetical protein